MNENLNDANLSRRSAVASGLAALMGMGALGGFGSMALADEPEADAQTPDVQADKEGIRDKISMYQRSMDRSDPELGYACFWDEATVTCGGYCDHMPAREYVDSCMANGSNPNLFMSQHQFTNTYIRVNDDKAGSESYGIIVTASNAEEENHANVTLGCCRYLDKWEKRDGDWRLVERLCATDGYFKLPNLEIALPQEDYARDKTDPSYEALAYGEE